MTKYVFITAATKQEAKEKAAKEHGDKVSYVMPWHYKAKGITIYKFKQL